MLKINRVLKWNNRFLAPEAKAIEQIASGGYDNGEFIRKIGRGRWRRPRLARKSRGIDRISRSGMAFFVIRRGRGHFAPLRPSATLCDPTKILCSSSRAGREQGSIQQGDATFIVV